ncbi:protein GAMETE EXPRESSED 1-like isoform X1 [Papaver somniferum]|uniref:protein GAMETE EXPRESSED 1-like isoform X1 n=2 Tax=Papaver somniferum TaxID=3469 RepID=UPI000E705557|nr:protein GAMETE EXPRESSED 1-like isoform X1 [Papaver somniferum]
MDQHHVSHLVFLSLIFMCLSQETRSFSLTWGSNKNDHGDYQKSTSASGVAKFSMELPNDPKGIESVETAKQRLASRPNSCWQNAYENLFATCSVIVKDDAKRSRLAWQLSDCFQKDSGRPSFPSCDSQSSMLKCLKKLDESAHKVYLEFYLQTNSICHQLQANAFKIETERLVNDLKKSAESAEEKLHNIEENSERLIQNSDQIENSLTSLYSKTQQVAETSEKVSDQIDASLKQSSIIVEQSNEIAASQLELRQGQSDMRKTLEGGMEILHESYEKLGHNVEKLRNEAVEIEKQISKVSNSMSTKMENLQNKANDIGNAAGVSLDKQKQLLDGQSRALEGLDFLTKFQSQALEESRASLQTLAEFGQKQQEELLRRQEQLKQAHDHLIENSKSILAAQKEFESKQASMFLALDKLFTLHNDILLESRAIKSFFFYSFVIFLLYMLTSAKQTYGMRARLYLGLCAIFLVEFTMCRFGVDLDQQVWIASKVTLARSSFLVAAAVQLLFSIFSYRDYEVLNHRMLETLIEKVNTMERKKAMPLEIDESYDDVDFSTWIDEDLSEEETFSKDPDFLLPEEVAENSVSTSSYSRKYDLRPRRVRQ